MPRRLQTFPWVLIGLLALVVSGQRPAQGLSRPRPAEQRPDQIQTEPLLQNSPALEISTRWSAEPGISRYRFQLARDQDFTDIVIDRLVSGTEYRVTNLTPGKYFWRVAPLGRERGEFSPPREVEAFRKTETADTVRQATRPLKAAILGQPASGRNAASSVLAVKDSGWRAALGNVGHPMLAHLRSTKEADLVGINSDGLAFALDLLTGVTLWATRTGPRPSTGSSSETTLFSPVLLPSRSGLENVVVPFDQGVRALEGASGRELWRAPLPGRASSGVAVRLANGAARIFVVDNSAQRLFILDGNTGNTIAQATLPARTFGAPAPFNYGNVSGALLALEDGRIEVRDQRGTAIRSGNANSRVRTPPLFVPGPHALVLVGTRSGLVALEADDLRALGRAVLKDNTPRGILAAADLDGDGSPEVITLTEHGLVMAISATDGKVRWEAPGATDADGAAFADLNGDGTLDVVVAAGQSFAMALSGRDGSLIWRAEEQAELANHATSSSRRALVTSPTGSGAVIVGTNPSGGGIRAIELTRPRNR